MQIVDQNAESISGAFGVDSDAYHIRFFEACKDEFIRWQESDEDDRRPADVIEDLRKQIRPVGDTEHFLLGFAFSSILEQAKAISKTRFAQ